MLRRLYEWVLHWAETPWAIPALAALAVAEASFFPIPPDVLLIAMAFSLPRRAFTYAGVCSVASVVGGLGGYAIGRGLMSAIGCPLVAFYHGQATFDWLASTFSRYDFWAVLAAAVTPIPYKIFTITAGAMGMNLLTFTAASALGRPARFFAVAALIFFFGPPVRRFLERYFNLLATIFIVLLVGGFLLMGTLGHPKGADTRGDPEGSTFARLCEAPRTPVAAPPRAVGSPSP